MQNADKIAPTHRLIKIKINFVLTGKLPFGVIEMDEKLSIAKDRNEFAGKKENKSYLCSERCFGSKQLVHQKEN